MCFCPVRIFLTFPSFIKAAIAFSTALTEIVGHSSAMLFCKLTDFGFERIFDKLRCRLFFADEAEPFFKIIICGQYCHKQIFYKMCRIVFSFMPANLTVIQCIIIQIFVFCDFAFKRYILSDKITRLEQFLFFIITNTYLFFHFDMKYSLIESVLGV